MVIHFIRDTDTVLLIPFLLLSYSHAFVLHLSFLLLAAMAKTYQFQILPLLPLH
jgi:hypothetical protein